MDEDVLDLITHVVHRRLADIWADTMEVTNNELVGSDDPSAVDRVIPLLANAHGRTVPCEHGDAVGVLVQNAVAAGRNRPT